MKRLLDHDKLTGITSIFHHDESSNESTIEYKYDAEPALEMAQALRNDPDYSKQGIKRDWFHKAHIPDFLAMKMLYEDGVNIHDQNDWKKMGELLDDKYARFLTTSLKHKLKG